MHWHSIAVPLAFIALSTRETQAQIVRPPAAFTEPIAWAGFSLGFLQLPSVRDGSTGATWRFGDALQYRVSLEKAIQNQSSIGLTATFARVPLTYVPFSGIASGCISSCDADANVTQVQGVFHAGGSSIGFHQILEISAGVTAYSNFRARQSGTRLPPNDPDFDLAFALGGGFGYTVSPNVQLNLVQDLALSVHQRTGLSGGERSLWYHYTTRLGARFGLGQK